jgi:hypothetical protein
MTTKTANRHKPAHAGKSPPWPHLNDAPVSAETLGEAALRPKQPAEEEVRKSAYLLWEAAGCTTSDGVNFWCEAEKQLSRGG